MITESDNSQEWFADWFDETYLRLYSHRNMDEARGFIEWLASVCGDASTGGVVDLACGAGRHAWVMAAEQDWRVTGIDLSPSLLREANSFRGAETAKQPHFVRGDLRSLPFASESFGLAVNLFTSFGYFSTDEEHLHTLQEMARILKPEGVLVLDLLNAQAAIDQLVHRDEKRIGASNISQHRHYHASEKRVVKEIEIHGESGEVRHVRESVRLFTPDELLEMLASCGLEPYAWTGTYNGESYDVRTSPRMITLSRKKR